MKKNSANMFAIVGCALMMACGQKSDSAQGNADSTKVDAPAAEAVEEKVEEKSVYLSPDLALNDLKGKVSKCIYKSTDCHENGKVDDGSYWQTEVKVFDVDYMLQPNAKEADWRLNDPRLKRNDKGQIVTVSWFVSDFGCDISEEYTYNENGTLKTKKNNGIENAEEIVYTYKADGSLEKSVSKAAGEGMIYRTTSTYRVLESDENGNWTRRMQTQLCEDGPDNGSGVYENSAKLYLIETREISYYK